ncbi:endonuclease domain-containing protein [Streptomyces sp. MUSC 125]|nr:endonuclease domain-containing protein [Streptomyces sp. MUSC 125]
MSTGPPAVRTGLFGSGGGTAVPRPARWPSAGRVGRRTGRAGHLKRTPGPAKPERAATLVARPGPCTIRFPDRAVHVDHYRKTGRVRDVLCFNCNSAIGKLGDDPDTARLPLSIRKETCGSQSS